VIKEAEHQETPEEEEESLRRAVRRVLKSVRLPALRAMLRVVRYAEEGKTPMAVAAEDLIVPYKLEAILREAKRLRGKRDVRPVAQEDMPSESQSRMDGGDTARNPSGGKESLKC